MSDDSLLEPLLSRPDLPSLANALNDIVKKEQEARSKFRRELTPSMKAEFIRGEIVVHSPAKAQHIRATKRLVKLIDTFVNRHSLGEVLMEKALVSFTRNDYEPDIVFFKQEKASQIGDRDLNFPIPDFIAEVLSDSTEANDRGVKFEDYALHGVGEYWIIDCDAKSIEQYCLDPEEKSYQLVKKQTDGTVSSSVIDGFVIRVESVFDDRACEAMMRELLG